jgi:5'-methylthioadenosine phosphorylase
MTQAEIGVLGGSGLYEMGGLGRLEEVEVSTPFGMPSDRLRVGELGGRRVAFLARHGRGHRLLPGEINYRANLFAMKLLGVTRVVSASAVGSLREHIHPLDIVLPDQFFDRTRGRAATFFGGGVAAHVSFADPVCPELLEALAKAGAVTGRTVHRGGTYLCMEGPQFSTKTESRAYRAWGCDVIGMTNLQEAKLAREAEICFATIALVTDYDCWHEEESVSVEVVIRRLEANAAAATAMIRQVVPAIPAERRCPCARALEHAVLTAPDAIAPEARERLRPLLERHLEGRKG